MIWKARYWYTPGHAHVTLFVAPGPEKTYANVGNLTMKDHELLDFMQRLEGRKDFTFVRKEFEVQS